MLKRGHEMENHAYTHPNMSTLSRARATAEIEKTKSLLKESLGVTNTLRRLRPVILIRKQWISPPHWG